MSSTAITLKRQHHRTHPCKLKRKNELLDVLLSRNTTMSILIVTQNNSQALKDRVNGDNIRVVNDEELANLSDFKADLLISYDLPDTPEAYLKRLMHVKTTALVLLDKEEEKKLYPIETLLGRTLLQEYIEGFEPKVIAADKKEEKTFKPRDPRSDERPRKNSYKSNTRDSAKKEDTRAPRKSAYADSKDKRENSNYLGKDENGKAIFSAKSKERNHKYDGSRRENLDNTAGTSTKTKPEFAKSGAFDSKKSFASKPYDKEGSKDKKPYKSKPYDKDMKKPNKDGSRRDASYGKVNDSAPKNTGRKINIKSLKPQNDSE
ncbi:hypothetical protein KKG72_07365 [bacterium]|nr:hypothetical protein [bacterium]MBU1994066.1 hypothetical protein [bacterium]